MKERRICIITVLDISIFLIDVKSWNWERKQILHTNRSSCISDFCIEYLWKIAVDLVQTYLRFNWNVSNMILHESWLYFSDFVFELKVVTMSRTRVPKYHDTFPNWLSAKCKSESREKTSRNDDYYRVIQMITLTRIQLSKIETRESLTRSLQEKTNGSRKTFWLRRSRFVYTRRRFWSYRSIKRIIQCHFTETRDHGNHFEWSSLLSEE